MNLLESAGFSRANPYYIVQQGKVPPPSWIHPPPHPTPNAMLIYLPKAATHCCFSPHSPHGSILQLSTSPFLMAHWNLHLGYLAMDAHTLC